MLNIRILFGKVMYIIKKLDYLLKQSNYIPIILFQALFA